MNNKTLLYIECSPRKRRSHSKAVAEKFLEIYLLSNPEDTIRKLDIWDMKLPEYDEFTADAKFKIMSGSEFSLEEKKRWHTVEMLFQEFNKADKYLFSIPMWNFSIPYKLKHYIDMITQPGLAFKPSPEGYEGLITNRPAVVIYSSGGKYNSQPLADFDYQKKYFELWLHFIGFKSITNIHVAPTTWSPAEKDEAIENAMERAVSIAAGY